VLAASGDALAAGAAFLSGIGSVLTGYLALRWERKRSREECQERIAALHEGILMRDRIERGKPMSDESVSP
jgi:hypothetical protein